MEDLIRREVRRTKFDVVIASQFSTACYSHSFRGIPALFEEAELALYWPGARNGHSLGTRIRKRLTWAKHRRYLSRVLKNFAVCTVASEAEREMLAAAVPDYHSVRVVPNFIDLRDYTGVSAGQVPGSLLFAGSLQYSPNYDAVMWFLRDIYPAIKARLPQARLTVTGDPGTARLPADSDVVLTGRVADVRPLLAAAAVSLAPIREGGGTRLKILESMALRTPVVTTSKGMEGLAARNREHLLVADTPKEFAQAVTYLLLNPEAAGTMVENAFELVRSQYDSEVVLRDFLRLVEQTAECGSCRTRSTVRAETPRERASAERSTNCEPVRGMRPTGSADRY
jgi:glycosyltransferase involved in cell wall biosynthesis